MKKISIMSDFHLLQQGTADVLLLGLELEYHDPASLATSHTAVFSWFEQAVQTEYM